MITNVNKKIDIHTKKIDRNALTKLPFFKNLMEKENKETDDKKSEIDF